LLPLTLGPGAGGWAPHETRRLENHKYEGFYSYSQSAVTSRTTQLSSGAARLEVTTRKTVLRPGLLQRLICYHASVVGAKPGGRDNRMQRTRPSPREPDRGPAAGALRPRTLSRGGPSRPDPASMSQRGGTPWAPPPPPWSASTSPRIPSTPACCCRPAA